MRDFLASLLLRILSLLGRTQQRADDAEQEAATLARERDAALKPVDSLRDLGRGDF